MTSQRAKDIRTSITERLKQAYPTMAEPGKIFTVLDGVCDGLPQENSSQWKTLAKGLVDDGKMDEFLKSPGGANSHVQQVRGLGTGQILTKAGQYHGSAENFITDWIKWETNNHVEKEDVLRQIRLLENDIRNVYKTYIIEKSGYKKSASGNYPDFLGTKPRWWTKFSKKVDRIGEDKSDIKGARDLIEATVKEFKTSLTTTDVRDLLLKIGMAGASIGSMITKFTSGRKAALYLGPMPLTHIRSCEIGHSGRVLKYRAVGSVFLAQQKGGRDTVKIKGLITGFEKILVFFILWGLFVYGKSFQKNIPDFGVYPTDPVKQRALITQIRGMVGDMSGGYNEKLQKPTYEKHLTFPLVTQHEIIPNCYIETFNFEETIEGGRQTIHYNILCRTYTRPKGFERFEIRDKEYKIKMKHTTRLHTVLNYLTNKTWRHVRYMQEKKTPWIFDNFSWKVKNGYDVDVFDMSASYLAGLVLPSFFRVW